MRVGVVGGSLGGLTAALCLRDAGFDVDVFERSPGLLVAYGAGLYLHEVTARWLVERAGVWPDEIGILAPVLRYLDSPGGDTVSEDPLEYRMSSWGALYHRLLAAFGRERYRTGHVLVGLDQDADGVELRFAGGARHRCDLAVCADGVLSTARALLFPEALPEYAGYVAWRGTVDPRAVSRRTYEQLAGALTYSVFEASHIVAYLIPAEAPLAAPTSATGPPAASRLVRSTERIGGGSRPHDQGARFNFVWYRNVDDLDDLMRDRAGELRPISLGAGEVQERHVHAIRRTARELLAEPLAELVLAAEPFVQVVVDVESPRMASGRVCIMGDAAFTARPHPAAGTAKACENAWTLAAALARCGGDVGRALAEWEPPMLALGRALVARAREMGERSQRHGTWLPGDPTLAYGLRGPGD